MENDCASWASVYFGHILVLHSLTKKRCYFFPFFNKKLIVPISVSGEVALKSWRHEQFFYLALEEKLTQGLFVEFCVAFAPDFKAAGFFLNLELNYPFLKP